MIKIVNYCKKSQVFSCVQVPIVVEVFSYIFKENKIENYFS